MRSVFDHINAYRASKGLCDEVDDTAEKRARQGLCGIFGGITEDTAVRLLHHCCGNAKLAFETVLDAHNNLPAIFNETLWSLNEFRCFVAIASEHDKRTSAQTFYSKYRRKVGVAARTKSFKSVNQMFQRLPVVES